VDELRLHHRAAAQQVGLGGVNTGRLQQQQQQQRQRQQQQQQQIGYNAARVRIVAGASMLPFLSVQQQQ
jgi:hypothetical protein